VLEVKASGLPSFSRRAAHVQRNRHVGATGEELVSFLPILALLYFLGGQDGLLLLAGCEKKEGSEDETNFA